ncbi:protein kinase, partial [Blomia tropicalis]
RPSLEKVVSWLDVETLCLLFGMMVLVAILCETGFFDYVAVLAFKMAKGRTWPLIFTLCFFTGILSAFLDNVTTILLMTPVTIRLCEIKNIDPKHVLIAQVMFSNIGGAATPVGDPPNVIIISSAKIQQQGVDFGRFTLHMMPGIILSFLATLAYFRLFYGHLAREYPETNENQFELQHEYDPEMNMAKTGTSTLSDNKPNQVISPNGPRRLSNSLDTSQYRRPSLERSISPRTITTTSHRSMFVSKSVGGHGGHDEHRSTDYDLSYSGRNRQMVSRTNPEPYFTCNSMEDFCAATPARDSILDERRVFRSSDELKREIEVWKRATNSISGYSRDENSVRNVLNRKVEILETILQDHCYETVPPEDNYHSVLNELEAKYKIRDYPLLYKSGIVMTLVISLFFMQSIPNLDLSLGWIAILGATLLLVLSDRHELDSIIGRVEWSTLIFFAALFVVMEALAELKFLWWIGRLTQDFINSVPEQHRLVVAILLFVWISAIASSFIDNIPLTTVMVKIIEDLSENNEFNIPLTPLIYALAFGACLGGNGTLIGASSNVVCAGVAEQHGYRFTFVDFFKVGFPIMIITIIISSFYLVLCHVVFEWNF